MLPELWQLISILTAIVGGAVYIKSSLVRQRSDELSELAATRGDRILDLEAEVHRMQERIAKLEGAYEALEGLKVDKIADAVVARLVGEDLSGL